MKLWRCQRGSLWVILAVLLAIGVGAWSYAAHKAAKRREEAQASELRQAQLRAAAERQEQRQREAERIALEQRLAKEKEQEQRNALVATLKAVDGIDARWGDAVKLASSTGRIALAPQIASLQAIRRDAEQMTVPPCLDDGKAALLSSMDSTIQGFLTFMRNDMNIGSKLSESNFEDAAKAMETFKQARAACPSR